MFRIENKPVDRVPGCPLSEKPRLKYQPPPKTTWHRFDELEIKNMNDKMQDFDPMPYEQRIVRKFYNNGGGLLTGAAGTGKTTLSDKDSRAYSRKLTRDAHRQSGPYTRSCPTTEGTDDCPYHA